MHTLRVNPPAAMALGLALLSAAAASGCGTDDNTASNITPSLPGDAGGQPPDAGASVTAEGGVTLPNQGSGTPDAGGSSFEQCAGKVTEAERQARPVNVVWVVDSSGSMGEESKAVQDNMNAFAQQIGKVGSDYRVVLITGKRSFNLNVPAPLGTDAMHFLYVDQDVGSKAPLQILNSQFGKYSAFLLKDAVTHFVVVTDDESNLDSAQFLAQMRNNLGANATFKVHAIASEQIATPRTECIPVINVCQTADWCDGAASVGRQHYAAADATGGLKFSICTNDWTSLFSKLGEAVSAPIPCELAIPEAPEGGTLDLSKVNVLFKGLEQTASAPIPAVKDAASCATQPGWYYDVPTAPTRINLCPASCTAVEKGGALELKLGCASELR